jgi:sulfonate transport system ATP-binding protein
VALARALVHRPKVLLLDEPLGALDALTRIEMHALIERLWLENGFTTLLVTHDVQEAVVLGDRVLVVEDGGIVFDVAVDLPRPRSRGSREFAALEAAILGQVLTTGNGMSGLPMVMSTQAKGCSAPRVAALSLPRPLCCVLHLEVTP